MEKTMHDFPNRLKNLRNKYGYTQLELAKKLSLTRASVNAWEMGLSAPSPDKTADMCKKRDRPGDRIRYINHVDCMILWYLKNRCKPNQS